MSKLSHNSHKSDVIQLAPSSSSPDDAPSTTATHNGQDRARRATVSGSGNNPASSIGLSGAVSDVPCMDVDLGLETDAKYIDIKNHQFSPGYAPDTDAFSKLESDCDPELDSISELASPVSTGIAKAIKILGADPRLVPVKNMGKREALKTKFKNFSRVFRSPANERAGEGGAEDVSGM
jgi:hypothetical protein